MPRATTTLTVRVSGTLKDFVALNVSDDGAYEVESAGHASTNCDHAYYNHRYQNPYSG